MCLIASNLNPFAPVVCIICRLRKRHQTKLIAEDTDLQYPGSPGEQIFGNFWMIMVDLQMFSMQSCKGMWVTLHRLQEDNHSFQAHHLL